jgi:aryl-alcohol dehydrogenase-like predicted oxidoreductase
MQYFDFNGYRLSRIFKGNWQLAGGHGEIDRKQALDDLFAYTEAGINAFDMGDIYTGAEEALGEFLAAYAKRHGKAEAQKLRMHTKFVPDLNALEDLTKQDVRTVIERSLKRLGVEQLHLVQYHWWDYAKGDFVMAASYLDELRQEGLIEAIGLTNFDVAHTQQLLDAGLPIVSNQIQFSLLDPRPLNGMLEFARKNNIGIFCYGALAGGLLGNARPGDDPNNRSHIKYELVIGETGEAYYAALLDMMDKLAGKYHTTRANIALAFVLQTPGVSSAIIGPRNANHVDELNQLDELVLDVADYASLRKGLAELQAKNKGDIYSYERDRSGAHGRIMKYNLNNMRPGRD